MHRKMIPLVVPAALLALIISCAENPETEEIRGPYFNQISPGEIPELFAPEILSTGRHEHSAPAFSPDGNAVYWSVFLNLLSPQVILSRKCRNSLWGEVNTALFSGMYSDGSPFFSPDGTRMYFSSNRPTRGSGAPKSDFDLWFIEKTASGWGDPVSLGPVVNTGHTEDYPSVARSGNIYFYSDRENSIGLFDIYVSKCVDGTYAAPENLGPAINTPASDAYPYIVPDESYILFCSDRTGGFGLGDLYICYRKEDGSWTKAANLGEPINQSSDDRFPQVSPDGKWLFFVSDRRTLPEYFPKRLDYKEFDTAVNRPGNGFGDIYWVDARILKAFRSGLQDTD